MKSLAMVDHPVRPGTRFGKLVTQGVPFLVRVSWKSNSAHVVTRCKCGRVSTKEARGLVRGSYVSCGACVSGRRQVGGSTKSPVYGIWRAMLGRCYSRANASFPNYGGRGIRVCDEWRKDFLTFEKWAIGNGFDGALEIDRKDNSKDYCPSNCRFITKTENARNKRNNVYLSAFGEIKTVPEWADDDRCAVSYETLYARVARGWDDELAITAGSGVTRFRGYQRA